MHSDSRGLIAWFTHNPVAANLLMGFLIFAGLVTASQIRKENFPDMKMRAIDVNIVYPGATPADVEEACVRKVESALRGLEGVKRITSTTYEGAGVITVEAKNRVNMQRLLDDVKSRVDGVTGFPDSMERPQISEQIYKSEVLWLALSGDVSHETLKKTAELLQDKLMSEEGVSQADIQGAFQPEIAVHVSESALKAYGLTFDEIVQVLYNAAIDLPAGVIRSDNGEIRIKTGDKTYRAADLKNIPVIVKRSGAEVPLHVLAEVKDQFEESNEFLRIDGKNGVGLQIFRTGDQSTMEVARKVENFVKRVQPELPDGVRLKIIADMSVELKDRLNLMRNNMLMGAALVFIALSLFLRASIAFWVMAGIPVSFLGAIALMPFVDATINMITLYGFILVLGVMVDDAIVVGESVHTEISQNGPGAESAIRGTHRVAIPVTYGVLTTVVAFLPMLRIPGAGGKLYAGIAYVVVLALLFSLIESKLILPAHLARIKPDDVKKTGLLSKIQKLIDASLNRFLDVFLRPVIRAALKHRYTSLAIFIGIMILTAGLIKGNVVRVVFFPDIDSNIMQIELAMAPGTPKAKLLDAIKEIETAADQINQELKERYGTEKNPVNSVLSYYMGRQKAGFFVELSPSESRPVKGKDIITMWRHKTAGILGVRRLKFTSGFEDTGSAVDFQLEGPEIDDLKAAAAEIKSALSRYSGVYDIRDSAGDAQPELKITLKPGAESLGVTVMDIAKQIRQGYYGAEVKKIQRGRDEIKVMVRYPKSERDSLDDLKRIRIRTSDGRAIPISVLADISVNQAPAEIYRKNNMRVVNVQAAVDKQSHTPDEIIYDVESGIMKTVLKKYPGVNYSLAGEAEEQAETMNSMRKTALLALFLIYALIAVPLKSYVQPLLIITAIPFGITGAVFGHLVFGLPVSILSLFGMIALAGVVVNDSLVLVDEINNLRRGGVPMDEALETAGVRRFRAIMLTSLTTFIGLVPMVLEKSEQAQFLIPMAVALAFGIVFSTVITLLLIPTLYRIGADAVQAIGRKSPKILANQGR